MLTLTFTMSGVIRSSVESGYSRPPLRQGPSVPPDCDYGRIVFKKKTDWSQVEEKSSRALRFEESSQSSSCSVDGTLVPHCSTFLGFFGKK